MRQLVTCSKLISNWPLLNTAGMDGRYKEELIAAAKAGMKNAYAILNNFPVGAAVLTATKYWPDGTRFRRYAPNPTVAKKTEGRFVEAITMGTWRELKVELSKGPTEDFTIKQFADIYLEEYCKIRNTRPDFKEETLEVIKKIVGNVKLKDFSRAHAHDFEKERATAVSGATVNRGLAVLSNLFTFALRKGLIDTHPMIRYGRIPEEEKALHILEPAEERLLVEKTLEVDSVVGLRRNTRGDGPPNDRRFGAKVGACSD